MPAHFHKMVLAELRAVFGRASGRGALALAVLVALASVWAMNAAQGRSSDASFNGIPVTAMVDFSWIGVGDWALSARNFFVLPLLLVLASAATLAGELGDSSLREVLVRPVPRWSVMAAKVVALGTLSLATLACTGVPAIVGGAALFGATGDVTPLLLGYLASWASDLGLIAMTLLVACFMRSVGGVVVLLILFLGFDQGARLLLSLLGTFGVEGAGEIGAMLPGAALACWEGWKGEWEWERFAGLGALWAIGFGGALARFQRMDVP